MNIALTYDELFPSPYLKTSDIGDTDKVFTITKFDVEEIGQDRDRKPVLSFAETDKRLVLNKTNAGTISNLYGQKIANWIGKRIGLYTTEVAFQGKVQLGIRVRMRVPQAFTPPAAPPTAEPPDLYQA